MSDLEHDTAVPNPNVKPTMSVAEAATVLGVSKRHLYRVLQTGQAPVDHLDVGGVIRVTTVSIRTAVGLPAFLDDVGDVA